MTKYCVKWERSRTATWVHTSEKAVLENVGHVRANSSGKWARVKNPHRYKVFMKLISLYFNTFFRTISTKQNKRLYVYPQMSAHRWYESNTQQRKRSNDTLTNHGEKKQTKKRNDEQTLSWGHQTPAPSRQLANTEMRTQTPAPSRQLTKRGCKRNAIPQKLSRKEHITLRSDSHSEWHIRNESRANRRGSWHMKLPRRKINVLGVPCLTFHLQRAKPINGRGRDGSVVVMVVAGIVEERWVERTTFINIFYWRRLRP